MKIKELQRLDYLLKRVNEESESKNYKIVTNINNKFYKVDFVPEIVNFNNTNERSVLIRNTELNLIEEYNKYLTVDLKDLGPWYDIFKKNLITNYSNISLLSQRSNEFEPYAYYESLIKVLNKHQFDFSQDLPLYVYNLKSLSDDEQFSFFPIELDTEFDFVSLVPEDTI